MAELLLAGIIVLGLAAGVSLGLAVEALTRWLERRYPWRT